MKVMTKLKDLLNVIESCECRRFILEKLRDKLDQEIDVNLTEVKELSKYLSVLASETRLAILRTLLILREAPVCIIATLLNKDVSLISHHLKYLKMMNLVIEKHEGKLRVYSVNVEVVKTLIEKLRQTLQI